LGAKHSKGTFGKAPFDVKAKQDYGGVSCTVKADNEKVKKS